MLVKNLIDALKVTGMSQDELVQDFIQDLKIDHRTNQASVIRTMQAILVGYVDARSDLRNEGAVEFAKEVKKLDMHIPFI